LTFTKVAGPTFMTVFTTNPGTGTGIGDIHLAPGLSDVGSYSATVRVSDGSLSDDKSFAIQINPSTEGAPTLAQPANMTVTEGTTADQVLTGTDPDGDPLTFSRDAGPIFMTVSDLTASTGNLHLAPSFADAGIYRASVRASDGILSDAKSLTITVNEGANRCPVANPGGPYSGFAGVPIAFDGSGSFDPDGNLLFYFWDFDASDGVRVDAVGAMASHAYASGGDFVVTLQVSDLGCTVSATTTATIVASCPATVFNGYDVIRLGSGKPTWFAFVQPAGGCYVNTDVVLSSFVLKYAGRQIPAEVSRSTVEADKNGDGIQEIRVNFSKDNLRTLFSGTGLGNGHNLVSVTIEANLSAGGVLQGTTQVDAFNNGSFSAPTVAPNPLNPEATLTFTTSRVGFVKVELYDVGGRLVRTILDEPMLAPGVHEARIEGRGSRGETLASGIYFIRGASAEGEFTKTVTILK
jgi:PKD repeat protein